MEIHLFPQSNLMLVDLIKKKKKNVENKCIYEIETYLSYIARWFDYREKFLSADGSFKGTFPHFRYIDVWQTCPLTKYPLRSKVH